MFRQIVFAGIVSVVTALQASEEATVSGEAVVLKEGKQIALRAKAELGRNLLGTLAEGGPVAAVEFCNERALPITEQLSIEQRASIKRVSDQPRNVGNRASTREGQYIAAAKASLAQNETPAPALHTVDGRWVAYYPILTDGMCLQCHGEPGKEVSKETLSALSANYPNDKAVGYGINELRGIWVIAMNKSRFEAQP